MSAPATRRPFTLVVCPGCDADEHLSVIERLRGTVRKCSHGMLVAAVGHGGRGTLVLLQPCWPDREPLGAAWWLGPLTDGRDAGELCAWVERGDWDVDALPKRLRSRVSATS